MRQDATRQIVRYYTAIPEMLKLLKREREELEYGYSAMHGVASDGVPRGSSPGKQTEILGLRAAENGLGERLKEIGKREQILRADQAVIRGCLDQLHGKYKQVIAMRYVHGYSWGRISVLLGVPDSTVRHWESKAVERLGEVLEQEPGEKGIAQRAARART